MDVQSEAPNYCTIMCVKKLFMLLVFQVKSIMRNQAGIEDRMKENADYRFKVPEANLFDH